MINISNSQKQFLVLVLVVSFLTSAVVGYIAGLGAQNYISLNLKESQKYIDNVSPANLDKSEQTVSVVEKVSPAVVSVIISKDLPVLEQYFSNPFGDDPFFNDFFGNGFNFQIPQYRQNGTQKQEVGGGTGFIITSDGMILTNKHVVEDTDAEYTVLMNDGKKYPAKVLARDPVQDLAIIKIDQNDLPILQLGNSDDVKIGQSVIAIGNALGEFRNTVSTGVVSGLSRSITARGGMGTSEELEELIQTDAAINQGNSGGPLLNLNGQVIGVNVAVAQGAQNIGFSIPINKAKNDIEMVKKSGKISYPYLGVRYVMIDETIKKNNNLSYDYGALIRRGQKTEDLAVIPGSPADKAGILENDIILEVSGVKVVDNNTLSSLISKKKVGDEVNIKIFSKDKEKNIKVKLEERK